MGCDKLIEITRLVVLYLLNKRNEATTKQVEDIIIRVIPNTVGVVANESPYQLLEEINKSVDILNRYIELLYGKKECIEKKGNRIRVRGECEQLIKELYEALVRKYVENYGLMSSYALMVLKVLDEDAIRRLRVA